MRLVGPRRPRACSAEAITLPSLSARDIATPPFSKRGSELPASLAVLAEGRLERERICKTPPLAALGELARPRGGPVTHGLVTHDPASAAASAGSMSTLGGDGSRGMARSRSLPGRDFLMAGNNLPTGTRPQLLKEAARIRQAHSRSELQGRSTGTVQGGSHDFARWTVNKGPWQGANMLQMGQVDLYELQ
jgi:hypothetical protein